MRKRLYDNELTVSAVLASPLRPHHFAMASPYPVMLACAAALALASCSHPAPEQVPAPKNDPPPARVVTETVTVRDRDLDQRLARLQLQLLDRDALVEDLQARLDAASRDAVRSMAKVQTLATRAEAASGMAEAQIVLQTLRRTARGSATPELARATKMLSDAASEFDHQNYGGALYLANQAKSQGTVGRRRVTEGSGDPSAVRPGESMFAVPVALRTTGRCNLRDGPGSTFKVLATLDGGVQLTGISYADQWMRVVDDNGREGWVFWSLVQKRGDAGGAAADPGR
ncbi:MAG TPA: SH3 domain-containing protein [Gemmatimonadales bacterium]